ncbi:hypothetical protein WT27_04255 [Burkholderia territorii]|uniref:DUF6881 domain-containing protein n=1 Tax=Burkholderia territorii TaxID=1503055 RepID=A0A105VIE0_9BURK|nr:hypothetical protein [Burkholderia territorii]KVV48313.1 hypothetical protein WT27_04255 [Burkholderia territorii]KVX45001.1 hypothetical protein WT31_23635 [Burkholderia territorii]
MMYIRVKWVHTIPSEPIWLYSELDSDRWEIRKVEVYADGNMGFADQFKSIGGTSLSIEPLPSISEIMLDPQFDPVEITKQEFEKVWDAAILKQRK